MSTFISLRSKPIQMKWAELFLKQRAYENIMRKPSKAPRKLHYNCDGLKSAFYREPTVSLSSILYSPPNLGFNWDDTG